jgi:YesN/AraC family two-component response regulator
MLLPDTEPKSVFVIGPFLSSPIPKSQVFEIGEKIGVSPKDQRILESIFSDIPVISTGSHFFAMLDAFGECIWGSATAFRELDVKRERTEPSFTVGSTKSMDEPDNLIVSMQMMEKRYHFENELMDAVALGQSRKVNMLLGAFSELSFERRSADPLRNAKNYCIITNTLLRKAAEKGGVHPLYLDGVSSSFATKIEQLPHASETKDLLVEMFTSYCRLVRKHSINSFSPTVQKTILLIESDLSADLSLSSLATAQNISPGYLSTIFKRETGKTITEYVIDKRIKLAARLLESTHLQVQTIALHCGIMDVQYFSKVFKKIMGKTPKEYRESVR